MVEAEPFINLKTKTTLNNETLQLRPKLQTMIVPSSRFIWIPDSSELRRD